MLMIQRTEPSLRITRYSSRYSMRLSFACRTTCAVFGKSSGWMKRNQSDRLISAADASPAIDSGFR